MRHVTPSSRKRYYGRNLNSGDGKIKYYIFHSEFLGCFWDKRKLKPVTLTRLYALQVTDKEIKKMIGSGKEMNYKQVSR
jgi:hypothetical protein